MPLAPDLYGVAGHPRFHTDDYKRINLSSLLVVVTILK